MRGRRSRGIGGDFCGGGGDLAAGAAHRRRREGTSVTGKLALRSFVPEKTNGAVDGAPIELAVQQLQPRLCAGICPRSTGEGVQRGASRGRASCHPSLCFRCSSMPSIHTPILCTREQCRRSCPALPQSDPPPLPSHHLRAGAVKPGISTVLVLEWWLRARCSAWRSFFFSSAAAPCLDGVKPHTWSSAGVSMCFFPS